jgi:hypothetical protein
MSEFDWQPYTRTPVLDVPSAVALGHALLSAMPATAPPPIKASADVMRREVGALQKVWGTSRTDKPDDPRPIDTLFDGAWTALRDRVTAIVSLASDEHGADVARAQELLTTLFPTGADFLKLPYTKQWAECDKRIGIVKERGLQTDIDRLAGAAFWKQIETLHQSYGEVLGITKSKQPSPEPAKLLEPLRTAQRAIGNYVLQVAATAAHDQAFAPQAVRALAPVDAVREGAARRASAAGSVPPVSPDTPVPSATTD